MKILLVGEYSRLHNSLKEGLIKLGHEVTLIGTGDGFKNYPVDIDISPKTLDRSLLRFIKTVIYKTTGLNISQYESAYRFKKVLPKLKDYDVVQLINERSIKTTPRLEIKFIKQLKQQNKKLFLLSSGVDYLSVKYALDHKFKYSILTPYLNNRTLKKQYLHILKYVSKPYVKLHEFLFNTVDGIIASDLDYHIPLKGHLKYLGLIPNPVNTDKLKSGSKSELGKIIIFHGINSANRTKKGNHFFENALKIIKEKYNDKVTIIEAKDLPYEAYMKHYTDCHIFLDQVYAYDQGYNALEAMARGKVVFTGAEQEWLEHYNLQPDTVAINALPDANNIISKLEWLIENPKDIKTTSNNARQFIETEHHYIKISEKYIDIWKNYSLNKTAQNLKF